MDMKRREDKEYIRYSINKGSPRGLPFASRDFYLSKKKIENYKI